MNEFFASILHHYISICVRYCYDVAQCGFCDVYITSPVWKDMADNTSMLSKSTYSVSGTLICSLERVVRSTHITLLHGFAPDVDKPVLKHN